MDNETKQLLNQILATVKNLEDRVLRLETGTSSNGSSVSNSPTSVEKKLSLKEFIMSRAPSNGVQMTLTIAYYLETFEGVTPFNAAELERGFRAAREAVPPNINDKANMCVKNGHLMEERDKKDSMKAWIVTRTGEEIVRRGFGKTRL